MRGVESPPRGRPGGGQALRPERGPGAFPAGDVLCPEKAICFLL